MSPSPRQDNTSYNLRTLVKRARSAVVSIEVFDDEDNPVGAGSGFFVSDDGLLVTNYHVIEKASGSSYGLDTLGEGGTELKFGACYS